MKSLAAVLIAAIALFASCAKQASKPLAQTMNGIEFKAKYGFELPFLDYSNNPAARGGKPKAAAVTLSVMEDLVLTNPSGNDFHSTISGDAEWFAFQRFQDTLLNAYCNANWSGSPVPPPSADCNVPIATGVTATVRTFSSDEGVTGIRYDVHLSNKIVKTGE